MTNTEFNNRINDLKNGDFLDYKKVGNIEFDGIDHKDYPDYCNAYILSAEYNGEQMTEQQIEELNEDVDFVYEKLLKVINI
jgi:hypothetical protein